MEWKGWLRPSNFWHNLYEREEPCDDLSTKWLERNYELTWNLRWSKLWEKGGPPRIKLWTWMLLHRAFFTGERTATMNVAFDPCRRCNETTESVPHLFYKCRESISRWNLLHNLASTTHANLRISHGLLEIVDEALKAKKEGGPLIFILYSVTSSIWKDRNQAVFQNRSQSTPLLVSLQQARKEIEASFNNKTSNNHWRHGIKALEEINKLINNAMRSATRFMGGNDVETDRPSEMLRMTTHSLRSNETGGEEYQASANSLITHLLFSRGNGTGGEDYQTSTIFLPSHPNSMRDSATGHERSRRAEDTTPSP
ncbi:hypothetical protein R1flu_004171 [Riccia fluitans]|uniref:Reverse transcriptase zinc-binding domain-containing protein n=1 Tax=Riccia fluitans TaxID=41844 RepID=A0ABD1YTH3_9MARC